MGNAISGFFISFSNEELEDIRRRLDLFGYEVDGNGLKDFIMDSLVDMESGEEPVGPTDSFIKKASDYIENNPEQIRMGINAVKNIAGMLKRKKS